MAYALHKFHRYFLGNKFIFYVDPYDIIIFSPKTLGFKENIEVANFLLGVRFSNNL
jgi:hypothetical protein